MRVVFLGFIYSVAFGVASLALMVLGSFLGAQSFWNPMYWPSGIFGLVGFALLYVVEAIPNGMSPFIWLVPEGGAPGVFAALVLLSFFGWGCLFTGFLYFKRGRVNPNSRLQADASHR